MATKRHLITPLKALLEIVFPKKKHSTAVEQEGALTIARRRMPIQHKDHLALLPYTDISVKHFLYAIKYERHTESIAVAADMLREQIYDDIQEAEMVQKMQYALCAIPITRERKKSNGYNHLHAILDVFHGSSLYGTPPVQDMRDLLVWTRHVARQSNLPNKSDRLKNVSGAMTTTRQLSPRTIYFVIDDVTTTGATLTEARRALLAHGAHTVITLALAH